MQEIFATVCLAGAIQALFLFLALLIRKRNRIANRYLSVYLFFVILDMIELFLGAKGSVSLSGPYRLSIIPYSFIFGPSMFLYVSVLTAQRRIFSLKYLLLYVPFIVTLAVNIILIAAPGRFNSSQAVNIIINGGGLFFEIILYGLSLMMLHKYILRLKDYFSDIDSLKLSFIRAGLVLLIIIAFLILLQYSHGNVRHQHEITDIAAILSGLVLIFMIAFFAVLQPDAFSKIQPVDNALPGTDASNPRYEKLRLSAQQEEEYVKKLKDYMSEKKPYLNEELTLQNLADELFWQGHHLSMILNIHFRQNFYNFINSYRVEDVKEKLADPDFREQNILSIAFSSGFNSKSTFNTMFKKFTGKTPSEFRSEKSFL